MGQKPQCWGRVHALVDCRLSTLRGKKAERYRGRLRVGRLEPRTAQEKLLNLVLVQFDEHRRSGRYAEIRTGARDLPNGDKGD